MWNWLVSWLALVGPELDARKLVVVRPVAMGYSISECSNGIADEKLAAPLRNAFGLHYFPKGLKARLLKINEADVVLRDNVCAYDVGR